MWYSENPHLWIVTHKLEYNHNRGDFLPRSEGSETHKGLHSLGLMLEDRPSEHFDLKDRRHVNRTVGRI